MAMPEFLYEIHMILGELNAICFVALLFNGLNASQQDTIDGIILYRSACE